MNLFKGRNFLLIIIPTIIIAVSGLLLAILKYNYFSGILSIEVYLGFVAVLFVLIGLFFGNKIEGKKEKTPKINSDLLSTREKQVLSLMAIGRSNKQIADELHLSLSTIKTHTYNMFSKLNVKNRSEAVYMARKSGILTS